MMKIAIVVFSPSGNTLRVGEMLEKSLLKKQASVQLINVTRNKAFVAGSDVGSSLRDAVHPHDVLCIGGPVYSKHLHYHVKGLIRSLPETRNGWGRLSVPFVTWGGVSSGVALYEAAKGLKEGGRTVVAGMKIEASHSLSHRFVEPINPGMPGKVALQVVDVLAARIIAYHDRVSHIVPDVTESMNYQGLKEKIKAHLFFREKPAHRFGFPDVEFHHDRCTQCGTCVKGCTIQRLALTEKGPVSAKDAPDCIHCAQCFHNCPAEAISFNLQTWDMEGFITRGAKGKGLLANREAPNSCVYP